MDHESTAESNKQKWTGQRYRKRVVPLRDKVKAFFDQSIFVHNMTEQTIPIKQTTIHQDPKGIDSIYWTHLTWADPLQGVGFKGKQLVEFNGAELRRITLKESVAIIADLIEKSWTIDDGPVWDEWGLPQQRDWLQLIAEAL